MQAVLAERRQLGQIALGVFQLLGQADVVSLTAAEGACELVRAFAGDDEVIPSEGVGDLVGIDGVGVGRDAVAERLDIVDRLDQPLGAAQAGVGGDIVELCYQ